MLAAVTAAGPFAAPMTTKRVGAAVRAVHGFEPQSGEDGRWYFDVKKSLADLVADGRLVTSKRPPWRKPWVGFDEKYQHLVPPGNIVERFYATLTQAHAWKLRLKAMADSDALAEQLAGMITKAQDAESVEVARRYAAEPLLIVTLTYEQARDLFAYGIEVEA